MELLIKPKNDCREFLHEGIPVMCADLTVPVISGIPPKAARRLNGYYEFMLRRNLKYAENILYPAARDAFSEALERGRLLPPHRLTLRYTVERAQWDGKDGAVSISCELAKRAGDARTSLTYNDSFSAKDGLPLLKPRKRKKTR
ncbi:MAG: hypothetical protein LBR85_06990 [Oscillospiraceae bacterium]|jgi:hypothetical protein|nr:hypothetical protein [Oscillospiraceae bacterium]